MEPIILESKALELVKTEMPSLLAGAMSLASVKNADSEANAVRFLGRLKDNLHIVQNQYDFLTRPLKEHIKAIKAEFDKVSKPLKQAEVIVKDGIRAWRSSAEWKSLESDRLLLESEARIAVDANDMQSLQAIVSEHGKAAALAPKNVRTSEGNMHTRTVWKFEITDSTLIPPEYMIPNEALIHASVKDGKQIAGVKAWQEDSIVIV